MTRGTAHAFTHDGEGRFLDQTAVLIERLTAWGDKQIGAVNTHGNKFFEVFTPVAKNIAWGASTFAYSTIVHTAFSAASLAGNMISAGYAAYQGTKAANHLSTKTGEVADTISREVPRAIDVLKGMKEHMGEMAKAAQNAAGGVQSMGRAAADAALSGQSMTNSTRLIAVAVAVTASMLTITGLRSAVCTTDPDSMFCISPFLTYMLMGSAGLAIAGWARQDTDSLEEARTEKERVNAWAAPLIQRDAESAAKLKSLQIKKQHYK